MQVLPATSQGEYAREGGLVDVTLKTMTYAVRLAKGHMLPPGAAPEEQSAHNLQWNVVVFYAALWHYLSYYRQAKKLSIRETAEATGYSSSQICRIQALYKNKGFY